MHRRRALRRPVVGIGLAIALASGCREHEPAPTPVHADVKRPPAPLASAPTPRWTHEFAGDPRAVRIDDAGRVFAIIGDDVSGEARLVAMHDGQVRWSNTDAFASRLSLAAGEVVAARRNEIVAYDPATGRVRWSAVLPAHGEAHPHARAFMRTSD
ncbi:MAG TPA: PQQ-binding-like beta-propeller repeat protein, partial [Nannocystaceae bacterium]|nr:PQQ-binding-like beta-propeller repeat protein [Nannocystaceae bacterium]